MSWNTIRIFFNNSTILQDFTLVDEVIPKLVGDHTNAILTLLPTMEETHNAGFCMKKDNASGGHFFFQNYWAIPKYDVYNATM